MKTLAVLSILIIGTLAGEGPSNCYKTCQGTAKNWLVGASNEEGMVKVVVDLTGCGFSSPPVVHTMLNGSGYNIQTKGGASGIRNLSATGFELNIHQVVGSYRTTPAKAKKYGWELLWTATGFGC